MNYFFFGFRNVYGTDPEINRVKLCDHPFGEMYCSHVQSKNYFIINGYDFKAFIFHIAHEEHIKNVKEIREKCGKLPTHVIVDECVDHAELLFALNTDTDLSIQVHFLKHTNQLSEAIATIFNLEE